MEYFLGRFDRSEFVMLKVNCPQRWGRQLNNDKVFTSLSWSGIIDHAETSGFLISNNFRSHFMCGRGLCENLFQRFWSTLGDLVNAGLSPLFLHKSRAEVEILTRGGQSC